MPHTETHDATEVTAELVTELLRDQHPDLADHPVRLGARGTAAGPGTAAPWPTPSA